MAESFNAVDRSFSRTARQGIVWLFGSSGIEQLFTLAITIILARLLTPSDYGLLGLAMIVVALVNRYADFGTGMAIVQAKEINERQLSSVFWFNIVLGFALALLIVIVSPLVAMFFSEEAVIPILIALAFTLPVRSLSTVHNSILRRQLIFQKIVRSTIISIIVAGTVSIVIAYLGGGVWALVAQQLVQSMVLTILLWILVKWRPERRFVWSEIRHFKDFTSGLVGFNTVNYFSRNADYILIGYFLGTASLGLYTLAYRIMLYPVRKLAGTAGKALFPAFARVQNDEDRLSRAYIRTSRYIALIAFPLMLGLAVTAEDFVHLVYGEEWLEAAEILPYLAIVGALQAVQSLYGSVIIAKGYTRLQFRVSLIKTAVTITGFAIGLRWGIEGVAVAYLITESTMMMITTPYYFNKCGTSLSEFVKAMVLPVTATLIMIVSLYLFNSLVDLSQVGLLLRFCLQVFVGGLVYIIVILMLGADLKNELWQDIALTFRRDKPVHPI